MVCVWPFRGGCGGVFGSFLVSGEADVPPLDFMYVWRCPMFITNIFRFISKLLRSLWQRSAALLICVRVCTPLKRKSNFTSVDYQSLFHCTHRIFTWTGKKPSCVIDINFLKIVFSIEKISQDKFMKSGHWIQNNGKCCCWFFGSNFDSHRNKDFFKVIF